MATETETAGVTQIPAGVWDLDTAHSTIGFVARHLMVSKVRGHFTDFSATITVGAEGKVTAAEAEIKTASVNSNDAKRDEHLRGGDFFESEKFPTMSYKATQVTTHDDNTFEADGELTIKGVTKPVRLTGEFTGVTTGPWGPDPIAGFSATADVDREAWGLTWNVPLEKGGVLVSKQVRLEIEGEAKLRASA
jgi:polyisoprenoid-binding protein YceI